MPKLLIVKEKRQYNITNEECSYEQTIAEQNLTDNIVNIACLELDNIMKNDEMPRSVWNWLNNKLEKNELFSNISVSKLGKKILDQYNVTCVLEEVRIKKYFYETQKRSDLSYCTATYTIFKGNKFVASELFVLNNDEVNCWEKIIIDRILDDIHWYELPKDNSRPIPEIWLLSEDVAGYFFHECIGHILEEDVFRFAEYKIGDKVINGKVDIYENWNTSERSDDFGSELRKTLLVRQGELCGFLPEQRQSEHKNIGNRLTEDPYLPPCVRMTHMFVCGEVGFEDELVEGQDIMYIQEVSGGECDPFSGEIGLCAKKICFIEAGKKTDYCEPMSLLFNIKDLQNVKIKLGSISKENKALCFKNGAIKLVKYTTPCILMDWRGLNEK